MPEDHPFPTPRACPELWASLCNDADAYVQIISRDGEVRYANGRAQNWYLWKTGGEHPDHTRLHDDKTCSTELLDELLALVRTVIDTGEAVTVEHICYNIRFRVTIRALGREDGDAADALVVSRRMRAWERVGEGHDARPARMQHHDPGEFAKISPRELEVLVLIGEGLTYAEIGKRLHRSVRTIERHRDSLGQKLGARNRVELARFAIRAGLCELPSAAEQWELDRRPRDVLDLSEPARSIAGQRSRPDD